MKIEYKEFIGIYEDVFPEGFCEYVIEEFERVRGMGAGWTRQQAEADVVTRLHKDDFAINLIYHSLNKFNDEDMAHVFFRGLQTCYDDYSNTFSHLKAVKVKANYMKTQKTGTAQGYHIWHAERAGGADNARVLVYTLYLNDLGPEDGGETEFLYQRLRVKPKKNTMVIWPADFTHVHRGNAVLGDIPKYISTGWFMYE